MSMGGLCVAFPVSAEVAWLDSAGRRGETDQLVVAPKPAPARRRTRGGGGSPRTVKFTVRFSVDEAAQVAAAADRSGLSVAAWLGKAGMDAALHRHAPAKAVYRDILKELVAVIGDLRDAVPRFGTAVGLLEESGIAGPDLEPVAAYIGRVANRADQVAIDLSTALRDSLP